jgi:hypothetical protein
MRSGWKLGEPVMERLIRYIDPGDCWLWLGYVGPNGYGQIRYNNERWAAHRLVWTALVGDIEEATLDHLCRVRHCVNPDHLEPTTTKENVLRGQGRTARQARQTHCKYGHPLLGDNLWVYRGTRLCRTCRRQRTREWKQRQRVMK